MVAFGLAALASACSEQVLEADNAAINNGKIYRRGADEPFSGKATNIPEKVVLPEQARFQFLSPLRAMVKDTQVLNRYFGAFSFCDVQVKEGVLSGEAACKYPNSESKRYEASFESGRLNGALTMYAEPPANFVVVSANFVNGQMQGPEEAFSPETGKRIWRGTWEGGVLSGEETAWDAQTGNVVGKATYRAGRAVGETVRYAADGKTVIYRATLENGLLNGAEDTFDEDTGRPLKHVEWKEGKKNGSMREWDRQGNLVAEADCQDDMCHLRPRATQADPNEGVGCVQRWINAFRKESGEQAAIAPDQIAEWDDWCKQGKVPE